jgi:hypothetical protein
MEQSNLAVEVETQHDAHAMGLIEQLEHAREPIEILEATARWADRPEIYAWLMLPAIAGENELAVVSSYPLPKENLRALIDEFIYAVGSTAGAYGATLPSPEVMNIHERALHKDGKWRPMTEPVVTDVGLGARGRLCAVLRVCSSGADDSEMASLCQSVAKIIGPYVDANLLARETNHRDSDDRGNILLNREDFVNAIREHIDEIRQRPKELGLLRIRLKPHDELADVADIERAYAIACALVEDTVRGTDIVGMLGDMDIGVLMPETGPRRALIAGLRASEILSDNAAVSNALHHYAGVSGWAIVGADAEGLLAETDMAVTQAELAKAGSVNLYT